MAPLKNPSNLPTEHQSDSRWSSEAVIYFLQKAGYNPRESDGSSTVSEPVTAPTGIRSEVSKCGGSAAGNTQSPLSRALAGRPRCQGPEGRRSIRPPAGHEGPNQPPHANVTLQSRRPSTANCELWDANCGRGVRTALMCTA